MSGAVLLSAAALTGYLLGSVPWGLLLLRAVGGPDPRSVGSGNIGATNVTRAGGRGLGLATLVLDAVKALAPALFFASIDPRAGALAGLSAVLGHCYPVWLRFSGGKGVATFLGACLGLASPMAPLVFGLTWGAVMGLTRFVSLASVAGCVAAAVATFVFSYLRDGAHASWPGAALIAASAVVALRHRANFARIRKGEEPHVGQGRTA